MKKHNKYIELICTNHKNLYFKNILKIGLLHFCFISSLFPQWYSDPFTNKVVCNAYNRQTQPAIVSDGSGGTVDAESNTVTVTGVTSFSTFALYRRIFGDCTGDGYVNAADLQRLGDCWHQTNSGEFTAGTDARFFNYNKNTNNGNQIIDAADLQVFGDCWHNGGAP